MPNFETEEDEYEHVNKTKKKLKVGYENKSKEQYSKDCQEMMNLNEDIADLFAGRDADIDIPMRSRPVK